MIRLSSPHQQGAETTETTKPKRPHGGKRTGSGRVRLGSKTATLRFTGEELEALEAQKMEDETLNMAAKRLIRWQLEQLEQRKEPD